MQRILKPRWILPALWCGVLVLSGLFELPAKEPPGPDTAATGNRTSATSVTPGDVHLQNSRVYVHVGKTGLGHDHAVVGLLKSGSLHLTGSACSGELVFDMKSFTADTDAARRYVGLAVGTDAGTRQQVDANMLGPAVLNAAKFPTAKFVLKSALPLKMPSRRGLPQYELTGDFTLHGVTRPIQIVADMETKDGWTHLRGGFSLLQTQFGMQPFTKAFGAIGVADKLTIWGDLWIAGDVSNPEGL